MHPAIVRRRAFTVWNALAVISLVLLLALISFPVFFRARENGCKASCQSNLKHISLGLLMYSTDYDDRLPLTALPPAIIKPEKKNKPIYGWADTLQPYLKSTRVLKCPSPDSCVEGSNTPELKGYTDYYFNGRLDSTQITKVKHPISVLMLGDGNDGTDHTDATYNYNDLPNAWRGEEPSPAKRHLDGANYAFVDGHVKWQRPTQITSDMPNGKNATFRIR
jgi:prepilin-type processing-associated H-X9-DG protein